MSTFQELGLSEITLDALEQKGFTEPTPIQTRTIPLLLTGDKDIVAQASTGTGKTAAFGLPILERIQEKARHVQALVLTPTRELALQVAEEINSFKGRRRLSILTVYGGQSIMQQQRELHRGVDIVVGTPGRVLDHLRRGTLKLDRISHLVLDEADEMCNMGFIDDVREIVGYSEEDDAPTTRQTLLFSATMPREVMSIAKEFMGGYEVVAVEPERKAAQLTKQVFYEILERDRVEALCRIIDAESEFYGLIFTRTKADASGLSERLMSRGYTAEAIHGDLSQSQRERILNQFRQRRISILVATDVAARGIDVPDLTHVVNFALPQTSETYVHRIGRTGRAGKEGVAVTLIAPHEFRKMTFMARRVGAFIEKGTLPALDSVIAAKTNRFAGELETILESGRHDAYMELSQSLLQDLPAEDLVAALLRHSLGNELDKSTYRDLEAVKRPSFQKDRQGNRQGKPGGHRFDRRNEKRVQVKAAFGRFHGMHPKKLVDFISNKAGLHPLAIQNVKVSGKFSTFTVPEHKVKYVNKALDKAS